MPNEYRVCVIGATGKGNYGHDLDRVWLGVPGAKIVAVADADEQGLAVAKKRLGVDRGYANYHEMLAKERPDIVSIAPRWIDQRRAMFTAAFESGCRGIYTEKPFCPTLEDADFILETSLKKNIKVAVAHKNRYSPTLGMIETLIADGVLGELTELRGRGKDDRRGGGQDLWVLGSHVMNMIDHLGGNVDWCMAEIQQGDKPATVEHIRDGDEGVGLIVGDNLRAMFGIDGRATAYYNTAAGLAGRGNNFSLMICGSKATIGLYFDRSPLAYFRAAPVWFGRDTLPWQPITSAGIGKEETLADNNNPGWNALAARDLISAVENDRHPECNVFEGVRSVEMILAVFASHRLGGQKATLPLKNRQHPLLTTG
jgi:predicted dehydrogenase